MTESTIEFRLDCRLLGSHRESESWRLEPSVSPGATAHALNPEIQLARRLCSPKLRFKTRRPQGFQIFGCTIFREGEYHLEETVPGSPLVRMTGKYRIELSVSGGLRRL